MKKNWKRYIALLLGLATLPCIPRTTEAATRGQLIFFQDFESAGSVTNSTYMSRLPNINPTWALRTEIPSSNPGGEQMLYLPLTSTQVNELKGAKIKFSTSVKAEAVGMPSKSNFGIKSMLIIQRAGGQIDYPQPQNVYGTFDWKRLQMMTRIPKDVTAITFVVGLQKVTGVAWFDNLRIEVARPLRVRPTTPATGTVYTGHPTIPRLRGMMVNDSIGTDSSNAQILGAQGWKANVARFQLRGNNPATDTEAADVAAYNTWLDAQLTKLDTFLPQAQANGLKVVIDLHTPPGGFNSSQNSHRLFQNISYQDRLVTTWQTIAQRYKNNSTIWGYDLVNEPLEDQAPLQFVPGSWLPGWNELAERVGKAIRVIDTTHAIIVESEFNGRPEGFDYLTPLAGVSGVVYSAHVYDPHSYTHQGVSGEPEGVAAPSVATLNAALQPVRDFQTDYNVQIYIGEFSVARWAPNAATYLSNVMNIFEGYGWDWSYHAFREWDGWDLERPTGHAMTPYPTNSDRLQQVRARLNLN
jgi:endoglucanase